MHNNNKYISKWINGSEEKLKKVIIKNKSVLI